MNRLLRAVHKFCTEMDMRLAVEKTVILSYGTNQNSWKVNDSNPDLEAAMVAKYLGVDIIDQGQNLIKPRESKMIGSAHAYGMHLIGPGQVPHCGSVAQSPNSCMEQRPWSFPKPQ